MLRSTRKIQRHSELIKLLILYPTESREAMMKERIFKNGDELTSREERTLLRSIKEKVNGSDYS